MLQSVLVAAALATRLSHQSPVAVRDNGSLPQLKFKSNGEFHISVFSDMHFGQDQSTTGPEQDRKTVQVMGDILDFESPDLVILNGDLINGDTTKEHNSTHYIDQVVSPMVDRNLTWAATYGNHDHSVAADGDSILQREQTFPGCRTQRMVSADDAGTTNYYLPVYSADCTDGSDCTPELVLWFFDSRGGSYFQGSRQSNWVAESVVTWFNDTSTSLSERYSKVIPSLAFVHIPINAAGIFQAKFGVHKNRQPGINDEKVVQQGVDWCNSGDSNPDCKYNGQDVSFMRALVGVPSLMGLFYGHDHGNSWCYRWDTKLPGMHVAGNGLNLCYGQHTGYGGYGDWIRGGRQIIVEKEALKDLAFESHIRLESGEIVGATTLNSTYNQDYYPETPNEKTYLSGSSSKF